MRLWFAEKASFTAFMGQLALYPGRKNSQYSRLTRRGRWSSRMSSSIRAISVARSLYQGYPSSRVCIHRHRTSQCNLGIPGYPGMHMTFNHQQGVYSLHRDGTHFHADTESCLGACLMNADIRNLLLVLAINADVCYPGMHTLVPGTGDDSVSYPCLPNHS